MSNLKMTGYLAVAHAIGIALNGCLSHFWAILARLKNIAAVAGLALVHLAAGASEACLYLLFCVLAVRTFSHMLSILYINTFATPFS